MRRAGTWPRTPASSVVAGGHGGSLTGRAEGDVGRPGHSPTSSPRSGRIARIRIASKFRPLDLPGEGPVAVSAWAKGKDSSGRSGRRRIRPPACARRCRALHPGHRAARRMSRLRGSRLSPMWNRGCASFSSMTTRRPLRASSVAAVDPAGPPPMTTTSVSICVRFMRQASAPGFVASSRHQRDDPYPPASTILPPAMPAEAIADCVRK